MSSDRLQRLYDEVARCNRCGFCQNACPVRRVTGDESNVARGRLALVRAVIEDRLPLSFGAREVLYDCLLCKACVANCFPKVPTPEIVVAARAELFDRFAPSHLFRYVSRHLLTDQDRLARLTQLIRSGSRSGLSGLLTALSSLHIFGGAMQTIDDMVKDLPERSLRRDLSGIDTHVLDDARPLVNYFVGCAVSVAVPDVGRATIGLLTGLGYRVRVLDNACCGMPLFALGDLADARMLARENLDRFVRGDAPIVTDCSTCASFLKDYPTLFDKGTPDQRRALQFATRIRDVVEMIPPESLNTRPTEPVTFHDPCHLGRYQGLSSRVRQILNAATDRYVELPEADWCCGGAGSYSVTHAALSSRILDRKMENVRRTGAATLLTSCPACILQLRHGERLSNLPLRVAHLTQFLSGCVAAPRRTHSIPRPSA